MGFRVSTYESGGWRHKHLVCNSDAQEKMAAQMETVAKKRPCPLFQWGPRLFCSADSGGKMTHCCPIIPLLRELGIYRFFYVKGKLLILKSWQVTKKLKTHVCQAKHIPRLNVAHKPPACDLWKNLESFGCLEACYRGQKQEVRLEMLLPA